MNIFLAIAVAIAAFSMFILFPTWTMLMKYGRPWTPYILIPAIGSILVFQVEYGSFDFAAHPVKTIGGMVLLVAIAHLLYHIKHKTK